MNLNTQQKLGFGSVLALLGVAGIVIGSMLGFSSLAWPSSFLLGFVFGILAGIGVALSISGLIDRRAGR
jgi:predicted ABC-type sugar transport system permease subunit